MVWAVLGYALLSDLATALGVLPFALFPQVSERWQGILTAAAGGMMVAASIFAYNEARTNGHIGLVFSGLLIGALFIAWAAHRLTNHDLPFAHLSGADARRSWLLFLTLFAHSMPEGVALGVGFATGEVVIGLMLALAIAMHNIPEGFALALTLHPKGVSLVKCGWYAVLSSLPQPLLAVPAYLLAVHFHPFLPFGLGFASGAMIFLTILDLVPESLTRSSRNETAWGFTTGLLSMLLLLSLFQ